MTDKKEIIIDGIDVSQCVYREKDEYNTCCCTSTKENEGEERITAYYGCKYNHNCHYKQLKRKEQECEELKKQLDRYLSQEEEDIRQLNNDNKLDDILSAIKKANDKMEKESKYKQALDMIEEYCMQCNLRWDFTAQIVLNIINKLKNSK